MTLSPGSRPRLRSEIIIILLFRLAYHTLSFFPFLLSLPPRRLEYSLPPNSPQSLVHHASHSFTTLYTSPTLEPRSSTIFTTHHISNPSLSLTRLRSTAILLNAILPFEVAPRQVSNALDTRIIKGLL